MSDLGRLWRTVRHLRPIQIVGRAHFLWHRPRVEDGPPPPPATAVGAWVAPAAREASMTGPSTFRFLGEKRGLDTAAWDDPRIDRLWRYNLHYFDDLGAAGAAQRAPWHRELVAQWIVGNPPPGGTAWEPYPTSLRVVNWIKWWLGGQPPEDAWLHSLAVQVRWLRRRLEWHLLGNHLFANAKALVFAGLYFHGPEADAWLGTGLRILERELAEQVLPDGGHFERSTMYHALALEDVLDLANLVASRAPEGCRARAWLATLRERAAAMLHWLRCMLHPDGGIALFNDAAAGIAPGNAELEAYAGRLGIVAPPAPAEGTTDLRESGYVRMARGPAVALLDLAPIGPDYLPGHAHADTLAFELSLQGRRVLVNGGTSCYGLGAQRLRERGTAWHSTVQVEDADSSEVWSGFRVGRRARIIERRVQAWDVAGAHDGWHALPGAPVHRRRWRMQPGELQVDDEVTGLGGQRACARYHLAPGLRLQPAGDAAWAVIDDHGHALTEVRVDAGIGAVEASEHAPRFGLRLPTQTLVVTLNAGRACTHWRWNPDAHPLPV